MPYFFTLLYIVAMLRPVAPVFTYVVNQDYISEFLCINKDKPMLQCNGKCFLAKKLEEQSEKKKKNLPSINLEEYPIGFVKLLLFYPAKETFIIKDQPIYSNSYFKIFPKEFFHPPTVTSNIS